MSMILKEGRKGGAEAEGRERGKDREGGRERDITPYEVIIRSKKKANRKISIDKNSLPKSSDKGQDSFGHITKRKPKISYSKRKNKWKKKNVSEMKNKL